MNSANHEVALHAAIYVIVILSSPATGAIQEASVLPGRLEDLWRRRKILMGEMPSAGSAARKQEEG